MPAARAVEKPELTARIGRQHVARPVSFSSRGGGKQEEITGASVVQRGKDRGRYGRGPYGLSRYEFT